LRRNTAPRPKLQLKVAQYTLKAIHRKLVIPVFLMAGY
jgi:hypothetical protein